MFTFPNGENLTKIYFLKNRLNYELDIIEIILFGKVPTFHANILIADIHTCELEKIHTPIEMILLPRGCEHFRG